MPLAVGGLALRLERLLGDLAREQDRAGKGLRLQELRAKGEAVQAFAGLLEEIGMGAQCADYPRKMKTAGADFICLAAGEPGGRRGRSGESGDKRDGQERITQYCLRELQELTGLTDSALAAYEEKKAHLRTLRDKYIERMRQSFQKNRIMYAAKMERRLVREPPPPDLLKSGNYERIESELFLIDDFATIVLKTADQQRVELRHDVKDWREHCINEWHCYQLEKAIPPRLMWDFGMIAINAHKDFIQDIDRLMRMGKKLGTPQPQLREQLNLAFRRAGERLYSGICSDLADAADFYYHECVRMVDDSVQRVLYDPNRADEVYEAIAALRVRLTQPPPVLSFRELVAFPAVDSASEGEQSQP